MLRLLHMSEIELPIRPGSKHPSFWEIERERESEN